MIHVTRMDGRPMVINADWIECVESTPDTILTLTSGTKILIRDSVESVVRAFKAYKMEITQALSVPSLKDGGERLEVKR